jgi:hypothetical protein
MGGDLTKKRRMMNSDFEVEVVANQIQDWKDINEAFLLGDTLT